MKRVLYALFPGRKEADEAVREVLDAGFAEDQVRLTVHEAPIDRNDLRHAESDARKGLLGGVLLGSLSGSALGFLAAGPLQLLPMPESVGALSGLALGVVLGGLGGVLYGAGFAARDFQELADHLGKDGVLITAELLGPTERDQVNSIFVKHGATRAA